MVNLMYLVFICMLALNMSKEVLGAFGLMNVKMEDSNTKTTASNNEFLASLKTKSDEDNAKYGKVYDQANEIKALSQEYYDYLEGLKGEMLEGVEDPTDYQVMDKADFLDQKFFKGEVLAEGGQEFMKRISDYRTKVSGLVPANMKSTVVSRFTTGDENGKEEKRDGTKQDWLNYHYEGFPLIASLTKITALQTDIKATEEDALKSMLAGELENQVSLKNFATSLGGQKTTFYASEKVSDYQSKIIISKTDATSTPVRAELTLDGRKLTKPGAALIAADKMNVVYRGVANPMSISIPGIPNNKVRASAPGLTKRSGSSYIMNPGKGRTVTINASGTLPDGKPVGSKLEFRIKDIPRPAGSLRGETGSIKMPRKNLEISTVGAILEDFDFDLNLKVSGFSFKVPGQPTVKVSGGKLNARAKSALKRAKRGDAVQIFDIKAYITNNKSYKLKKVSNVFVELTN